MIGEGAVMSMPAGFLRNESMRLRLKLVRRTVRRAIQAARYHRLTLRDVPILFANSFPKSGTHLLMQVLQGFTQIGPAVDSGLAAIVTYDGSSGEPRSLEQILSDVYRLLPADIAYGHLHAHPQIVEALCRQGMAPFFILRDPRDVVVSHVYYVTEMEPTHAHHRYYRETLQDFDERLRVSILGRAEWGALFPNIRQRFEPYLGWLHRPEVLTVRYEDFLDNRRETLERILDHALACGFPLACDRPSAIQALERCIRPAHSPTFRQGKSGSWRECFNQEHRRLFKEVAGDLLIMLSYEQDDQW